MSELYLFALDYSESNLSVIPIQPRDKKPLVNWQPYQNTRATEEEVKSWWSKWPEANVGIVTGAISGLVVIDLDTSEAKDKLKELLPNDDLSTVPRSRTGKGWQLFFKHPGVLIQNRTGVIAALDVRGDGGYVVAPPSIHPSGREYKWEVPINGPLPELPQSLSKLISSTNGNNRGSCEPFDTRRALHGVSEGQRDENLFRLACKLRSADIPKEMAETLVLGAARNCTPPFPELEALEKIRNAYQRYEPAKSNNFAGSKSSRFSLVDAKDLVALEEPETEWLWEGVLPTGGLSLLVAKPKVGKTTLAFNLSLSVASGSAFLGRKTKQSPVVYLALEEKRSEIRKKLKAIGDPPDGLHFHFGSAPEKAVEETRALIRNTTAGFLVVDVLQKFCRVRDLNDYAQVTNALEPLMAMAREENCHILLTHHAGKADRRDGDDILGSTALLGGVDTLIQIKKRDSRRTFFTIQRYGEDIGETVIELATSGALEAMGSRLDVEIEETVPKILEALHEGPLVEKEIWDRVEKKHDVVAKALRLMVERGMVGRTGSGKKGNPYSYEKILALPRILSG